MKGWLLCLLFETLEQVAVGCRSRSNVPESVMGGDMVGWSVEDTLGRLVDTLSEEPTWFLKGLTIGVCNGLLTGFPDAEPGRTCQQSVVCIRRWTLDWS